MCIKKLSVFLAPLLALVMFLSSGFATTIDESHESFIDSTNPVNSLTLEQNTAKLTTAQTEFTKAQQALAAAAQAKTQATETVASAKTRYESINQGRTFEPTAQTQAYLTQINADYQTALTKFNQAQAALNKAKRRAMRRIYSFRKARRDARRARKERLQQARETNATKKAAILNYHTTALASNDASNVSTIYANCQTALADALAEYQAAQAERASLESDSAIDASVDTGFEADSSKFSALKDEIDADSAQAEADYQAAKTAYEDVQTKCSAINDRHQTLLASMLTSNDSCSSFSNGTFTLARSDCTRNSSYMQLSNFANSNYSISMNLGFGTNRGFVFSIAKANTGAEALAWQNSIARLIVNVPGASWDSYNGRGFYILANQVYGAGPESTYSASHLDVDVANSSGTLVINWNSAKRQLSYTWGGTTKSITVNLDDYSSGNYWFTVYSYWRSGNNFTLGNLNVTQTATSSADNIGTAQNLSGDYTIRSAATSNALTTYGASNGDAFTAETYSEGDPGQIWQLSSLESAGYWLQLKNPTIDRCITSYGDSRAPKNWGCTNHTNQRFQFRLLSNGNYLIRNQSVNQCLTSSMGWADCTGSSQAQQWQLQTLAPPVGYVSQIHNRFYSTRYIRISGTSDGAALLNSAYTSLSSAKWHVAPYNGEYKIYSHFDQNICLDSYNGNDPYTWTCSDNNPHQTWYLIPTGGGYFYVKNKGSNKCLYQASESSGYTVTDCTASGDNALKMQFYLNVAS